MKKLIIGLSAFLMIANSVSSQTGLQAQEISTRFGVLSVDEDNRLLFQGQSLNPPVEGNNSLDLGKVISIGATDMVLITNNGGTGCPFLYYFVSISTSEVKASPPFGTCAEVTSMKRRGNSILLIMPGFRGPASPEAAKRTAARQRHIFVFRAGVVTQNGRPVK